MVFLTLGSITFADFEIPSSINFGGEQSLSDKKLVGGKRQIDAMGRIDDEITWSGWFRGSTATQRARFVDGMRVKAEQIELKWSQFNYSVVIKSFKPNFNAFYEIPYTIVVSVIQDLNKPFNVLVPTAFNDSIDASMVEINDLSSSINDPGIGSSIGILSTVINGIPSISNASSSILGTISGPLNSSLTSVSSYIGINGGSTILSSSTSEKNSDVVSKDFINLYDAYLLKALLIQIQTNISLISKGSSGRNIVVNGGSLYQLASKYYGDATLWTNIAKANGMVDPTIYPGISMNIVIPNQTTNNGGIYQS